MTKVTSLLLTVFLFLPAWAQADEKIRGTYEVVGDINKLKNINTIEMAEFFNYSCGHCYRFLETSKRLRSKFKDKLHHKKFPIYWGNQTAYPAMAFYIADELGVEEEFTQELFDTGFKLGVDIFQPKVIKFLARDFEIGKEMTEGMQSASIKKKTDRSLELAKQFKANETPTIIINDILKVAPSMSNGSVDEMTDNLELIFSDILKNNG
ncbi:MAG: thioredoxin domain-containing protein [Nitrospinae bacterium]|nr:thioredoxin domain-containing protein [Nitrospinota bacterium]MZH41093.1 thioredoxin domain-containing protein [Nitrospinota bacterium]MZH47127.1 thioredoxin domain-containing protein [Nitrospinota bacterium]